MSLVIDIKIFSSLTNNVDFIMKNTLQKVGDEIVRAAKEAFQRRSFDNKSWKPTAHSTASKGKLANSLRQYFDRDTVTVISDLIYAGIQK